MLMASPLVPKLEGNFPKVFCAYVLNRIKPCDVVIYVQSACINSFLITNFVMY
uniref:Uncharacterized protein n=1 Tax=Anguilla anguilla TaxID=7936 RepID=A0A0E9QXG7_ANGAN